ncbi:MAG TPA: hypothetical protein VN767_01270 [Streptosporangiaceae bacterium]|nr:hypothetical protein [Streptosporangiaceae bacterium]
MITVTGHRWRRIASSVTTTGRNFSLKITTSALPSYANPDGTVNFEAFAVTKHTFSAYGFSANMDGQEQTVNIGTIRLWPAASKDGFPNIAAYLAHPSGAVPDIHCATPQLIKVYHPQWAKVGFTSIRIAGNEHQQFTYDHGQSSSLGIAYAQDDWSEDGHKSMSSNSKVPFARKGSRASWDYKTQFKYGLYDTGPCGELTEVYSYFGGSESLKVASVKATHCTRYQAHTSPSFSTSKAGTFGLGIPVPPLGITLSAQTGWDSDGFITYYMGSHGHDLCGENDGPGGNPGKIVMGRP